MSARTLVVAGTEAGVGKTRVTGALARALADQGARVVAIKPIDTGCRGERATWSEDGVILARATGQAHPRQALCRLRSPGEAPVAAREDGGRINYAALLDVIQAARADADWVLVEGCGGLMSPLDWEKTTLDLATDLEAEALLVAADRPGVVGHTRAAARLLALAKVPVRELVISRVEPPPEGAPFSAELGTLLRFADLPAATGLPHLEALTPAARALAPVARRLLRR